MAITPAISNTVKTREINTATSLVLLDPMPRRCGKHVVAVKS
jgi:hypothetical protein